MTTTNLPKSTGYLQLGSVFKCLEENQLDSAEFGEDMTGYFTWYLSPRAIAILEKKRNQEWMFLKHSQQFNIKYERWQGCEGLGVYIQAKTV